MPTAFLPVMRDGAHRRARRPGGPAKSFGSDQILALQRQAGNAAVASLFRGGKTPALTVQRAKDFGLATSKDRDTFVLKASADLAAMQDKTIEEFARALVNEVNAVLAAEGIFECKFKPGALGSDTAAYFTASDWTISVDTAKLQTGGKLVRNLTRKQAADLAQTIYHEARHAEQRFRVAQLLAGRKIANVPGSGGDIEALLFFTDDIRTELRIPFEVAWLATIIPSKVAADPANQAKIEGWRAFAPGGKHYEYQRAFNTLREGALEVVETIPSRTGNAAADRVAMDKWATRIIDVNVAAWKIVMGRPFEQKAKELEAIRNPSDLDRSVKKQFSKVVLSLTRVLSAARTVTEKKPGGGVAEIELAQMELSSKVFDLYFALNEAYEAYPQEVEARDVAKAVDLKVPARTP
jgi:hypothetical protein